MPNQHTKKKAAAAKKSAPEKPIRNNADGRKVVTRSFLEALEAFSKGHAASEIVIVPNLSIGYRESQTINPCTKKALDQKLPHFTLLPGDNFTPILVKLWIDYAQSHGVTSPETILDARALLRRIEDWRRENPTRCKIPN